MSSLSLQPSHTGCPSTHCQIRMGGRISCHRGTLREVETRDPHLKTDRTLELGFPEGCVYLVLRLLALPALLVEQHLLQQLVELVEGVDLGTRAK